MDRLLFADYDDFFAQLLGERRQRRRPARARLRDIAGVLVGREAPLHLLRLQRRRHGIPSKSPDRAIEELDFLMERHGVREIELVDNILDMRYFSTFLKELEAERRPRACSTRRRPT